MKMEKVLLAVQRQQRRTRTSADSGGFGRRGHPKRIEDDWWFARVSLCGEKRVKRNFLRKTEKIKEEVVREKGEEGGNVKTRRETRGSPVVNATNQPTRIRTTS